MVPELLEISRLSFLVVLVLYASVSPWNFENSH